MIDASLFQKTGFIREKFDPIAILPNGRGSHSGDFLLQLQQNIEPQSPPVQNFQDFHDMAKSPDFRLDEARFSQPEEGALRHSEESGAAQPLPHQDQPVREADTAGLDWENPTAELSDATNLMDTIDRFLSQIQLPQDGQGDFSGEKSLLLQKVKDFLQKLDSAEKPLSDSLQEKLETLRNALAQKREITSNFIKPSSPGSQTSISDLPDGLLQKIQTILDKPANLAVRLKSASAGSQSFFTLKQTTGQASAVAAQAGQFGDFMAQKKVAQPVREDLQRSGSFAQDKQAISQVKNLQPEAQGSMVSDQNSSGLRQGSDPHAATRMTRLDGVYSAKEAVSGQSSWMRALEKNQSQVDIRSIIDQIVQKTNATRLSDQKFNFSATLKPEWLGRLSFQIQYDNGIMNGRFLVESEAVKELLQQHLSQLKKELHDAGISIENFDIMNRDQQSGNFKDYQEYQDELESRKSTNFSLNNNSKPSEAMSSSLSDTNRLIDVRG